MTSGAFIARGICRGAAEQQIPRR